MDRRTFMRATSLGLMSATGALVLGCKNRQTAHVLDETQGDMVGSHAAGSEIYGPLINEAVGKLLGRQISPAQMASFSSEMGPKRVCFIGVENKSAEELGDFNDQIYQLIDAQIVHSDMFVPISRRFTEAGLRETRLRADDLFVPEHRAHFTNYMSQSGQPFDYLLFATVTSGTTKNNASYQRDYTLSLEMVDIEGGVSDKEIATLRKGYHKTKLGEKRNYGWFN